MKSRFALFAFFALAAGCTPLDQDNFNDAKQECENSLQTELALPIEQCMYEKIKSASLETGRGIKSEGAYDAMMARRMEIAGQLDQKKISRETADIETIKAMSAYNSISTQEELAERQAKVGLLMGASAIMQTNQPAYVAPTQTTCHKTGMWVNCSSY